VSPLSSGPCPYFQATSFSRTETLCAQLARVHQRPQTLCVCVCAHTHVFLSMGVYVHVVCARMSVRAWATHARTFQHTHAQRKHARTHMHTCGSLDSLIPISVCFIIIMTIIRFLIPHSNPNTFSVLLHLSLSLLPSTPLSCPPPIEAKPQGDTTHFPQPPLPLPPEATPEIDR